MTVESNFVIAIATLSDWLKSAFFFFESRMLGNVLTFSVRKGVSLFAASHSPNSVNK